MQGRKLQCNFPNEMPQNNKNWQLKASFKKYKQWQENKTSNPMIKTFQYLHMLMRHREVIQNLS